MVPEVLLTLSGIKKSFSKPVLNSIDMQLNKSECLGLLGANGAGKSTLSRILGGSITDYEGEITIADRSLRAWRDDSPVSTVHQELSQIPNLSIAENIFFGRLPNQYGVINQSSLLESAKAALELVGLESLDALKRIEEVDLATRQLIEIARAIAHRSELIILDEPTSSLNTAEVQKLFKQIHSAKERETSVLFISHKLDEVFAICDRIAVLRDGEIVLIQSRHEFDEEAVLSAMSGEKSAEKQSKDRQVERGTTSFNLKNLRTQKLKNFHLKLQRGEIAGLHGLDGAGHKEILKALFGLSDSQGELTLHDKNFKSLPKTPYAAFRQRIGYVPEDRQKFGLLLGESISLNICLNKLKNWLGWVNKKETAIQTLKASRMTKLVYEGPEQSVSELSGGNQQKAIFARWLEHDLALLLLDEPTRGVDVRAREELHEVIRDLAYSGTNVIIASNDLKELMRSCDRIITIVQGKTSKEFWRESWDEAEITAATLSNA